MRSDRPSPSTSLARIWMPVAPRFHSGCQTQVPSVLGSEGASNQPLGVRRSDRPSPLTSPVPTPLPAAAVPKLCFLLVIPLSFGSGEYHTTTLVVVGWMSSLPSTSPSIPTAATLP